MAITWTAKPVGAGYRYTWTPPLADGDSLASYTVGVVGATIDSEALDGNDVVVFVSGGTAGETATFTFTGTSVEGETFDETVYLPIRASAGVGTTVSDVVSFALRKVFGNGASADADAVADAVERLNDMLAHWAAIGADPGHPFPVEQGDTLLIPDQYVSAIKYNLKLACHEHYGIPLSQMDVMQARATLATIRNAHIPAAEVEYF